MAGGPYHQLRMHRRRLRSQSGINLLGCPQIWDPEPGWCPDLGRMFQDQDGIELDPSGNQHPFDSSPRREQLLHTNPHRPDPRRNRSGPCGREMARHWRSEHAEFEMDFEGTHVHLDPPGSDLLAAAPGLQLRRLRYLDRERV